jgi:hypothetical protein
MAQLKEGKKELFVVDDKLGTPYIYYRFCRKCEATCFEKRILGTV